MDHAGRLHPRHNPHKGLDPHLLHARLSEPPIPEDVHWHHHILPPLNGLDVYRHHTRVHTRRGGVVELGWRRRGAVL